MPSLLHLKTFATVAKNGSFTKAAFELSLTQPAVSGHIAALERELGMPLFNRTGKKIVLTDAGKLVYDAAEDIFKRVKELRSDLTGLKDLKGGTITIGASKIVGTFLLPKILASFRRLFPDIKLEVHVRSAHTIISQVADNVLDLAIVAESPQIPSSVIGKKVISSDDLVVIASANSKWAKDYKDRVLTLEEIKQENFILPGKNSATYYGIKKRLEELDVHLEHTIEIDSAGAIKRTIEEGGGLTIISKSAVQDELLNGKLIELPVKDIPLSRDILMLWRHDRRFSKNTEAFMQFLQKELSPSERPICMLQAS